MIQPCFSLLPLPRAHTRPNPQGTQNRQTQALEDVHEVAEALYKGGFRTAQSLDHVTAQDLAAKGNLPSHVAAVVVAKVEEAKVSKTARLQQSFTEAAYYLLSLYVMYRLFRHQSWFWPSGWEQLMYDGRVQHPSVGLDPYTAPAAMKAFYMMETGWYVQGLVRLLLAKKKKDFTEMLVHHLVTLGLLSLSYGNGYMRVGVVVVGLHNAMDPLLHIAKCFNYVELKPWPDVFFGCCMITFAVSRLYYYPQVIYRAWAGVFPGDTCNGVNGCVWDKTPVEFTQIGLLAALMPIHFYWFYLMTEVLKKAIKGEIDDVRSDDDEDDSAKTKTS